METTYGLPKYVMPPASDVEAAIVDFCRRALAEGATPVLYAYALGKTQELLRLVGNVGLPVMIHPQAWQLARIYRELGEAMPPHPEFDAHQHSGHVVIAPRGAPLLDWINPKRIAAVTGWALDSATKYRYGCDEVFPTLRPRRLPGITGLGRSGAAEDRLHAPRVFPGVRHHAPPTWGGGLGRWAAQIRWNFLCSVVP